jgi:transposase
MVNAKLEAQRKTIFHFWMNGIHSPKEIHEKTNIPLRTVENNLKKLKETGSIEHKGGNGRPSKVTQNLSRSIGQVVRHNTAVSTHQLAIKLQVTHNVSISQPTVWRHMKKKGYKSSVPIGTPMLTTRHFEARIAWTQTHLNDNWSHTIFTDETAFDLFRNKIRRWHKDGQRPVRRLPKSRQKVMAWGGISLKGKTSLFCFTDIMNGPYYVNILQTQLLPSAQSLYGRNWRLQQDNDPKHTSRVAKDFIAENKINTIDWPSNSPDLNPIENIWYIMKNNVEKRMPRNVAELKRFMVEEWEKIPQETVKNIIMSMKRRCELVLEKNGDRISY